MKNGKKLALKNTSISRKKMSCGNTSKRKLAKILLD
jgi:hypothetical protein